MGFSFKSLGWVLWRLQDLAALWKTKDQLPNGNKTHQSCFFLREKNGGNWWICGKILQLLGGFNSEAAELRGDLGIYLSHRAQCQILVLEELPWEPGSGILSQMGILQRSSRKLARAALIDFSEPCAQTRISCWKTRILEQNLWICTASSVLELCPQVGIAGRCWVGSVAQIPAGCGNCTVGIWVRAILFQ